MNYIYYIHKIFITAVSVIKYSILITCLFISNSFSMKGDLVFHHITIEQGLSQNTVFCIFQDNRGFLWFGTQDGLNRYDGYNFVIYNPQMGNQNSLSNNTIRSIYEDRFGELWLGTEGGGLNRFDRAQEKFIRYQTIPNNPTSISHDVVSSIFEDEAGMLWIATDGGGLNRFNRVTGQFSHYRYDSKNSNSLSSDKIKTVYKDKIDIFWIATDGGGLNRFNRVTGQFSHYRYDPKNSNSLSSDKIMTVYKDNSEILWIGTDGGGLNKLDIQSGKITRYLNNPNDPNSLSNDRVYCIYEDNLGSLWVGTELGLNLFDREIGRFINYRHDSGNPASLISDRVRCFYPDRSDILWIGTYGGGASKFIQEKNKFDLYQPDLNNPNSLSNASVRSFYVDNEGIVWIGTDGGGLNKLDRSNGKFTNYRSNNNSKTRYQLNSDYIFSIYQDRKGIFWLGTYGGGLNKFDSKTERFTSYKMDPDDPYSLSFNNIRKVFADQSGAIWIGTDGGGLNRFDPNSERFTHFQHDPKDSTSISHNRVWCICEDRTGNIWLGTYGGGINKFNPETQKFTRYYSDPANANSLSYNHIITIYNSPSDILWIGTDGGGLNEFDPEKGIFSHYKKEDGLPNNTIYGILEDDHGNLWFSHNKGITKFNPQTNTIKTYDVIHGLQSNEFSGGSCFKSSNGEMFFGGINGFNAFYPDSIKDNPNVPPVVITDFQIFNKAVPIGEEIDGGTILTKSIIESESIELSYKDRVISFEFAALNFTAPEKNQYAYMMENLEEEWNYVGNRRFVSYTNIPPEEYIFRVKASNSDGVWNEEGTSLNITIIPPFWQTAWFQGILSLLVIILIYTIYQFRVRSIKERSRELEERVKERTTELRQEITERKRAEMELRESSNNLKKAKQETDDIMQNVEEGLFLLNTDYEIGSQYSSALENIFHENSLGKNNFLTILKDKVNEDVLPSVKEYLELMFSSEIDEMVLGDLNPLANIELVFNHSNIPTMSKYLTFKFRRVVMDQKTAELIVTVNDISQQVQLSKKLEESKEESKRKMEWLLSILHIEPQLLKDFIDSAQTELKEADKNLKNEQDLKYSEILKSIYRSVHLIKGNASILDLKYFADQAHLFEDLISKIQKKEKIDSNDFISINFKLDEIRKAIDEINDLIEKISEIHNHFRPKRSYESEKLIKSIDNYVKHLQKDSNKNIKFKHDQFDIMSVPHNYRLVVKDILIQLIRNSIAHGIEDEAEREKMKKSKLASIELSSKVLDNEIQISFKDDGRGLNIEKLRQKAKELGKWKDKEIDAWSDKRISELIFESGVSTADKTDMTAGRGVGMDIVINKINQCKGKIEVQFKEGEFCEFEITLPWA